MTEDAVTWLRGVLDEDERIARACEHQTWTQDGGSIHGGHETDPIVEWVYDEGGWEHIARHDPASVLADIAAKRAILGLHAPVIEIVEWWDAADHTGKAAVCSSCGNREPNEWDLGVGNYGTKPEGWLSPYVLAPCPTLRLLASAYADRPGYRQEWKP